MSPSKEPLTLRRIEQFYNNPPKKNCRQVPIKVEEVPGYIAYVLLYGDSKSNPIYNYASAMELLFKYDYPNYSLTHPKMQSAVNFMIAHNLLRYSKARTDQSKKIKPLVINNRKIEDLKKLAQYWIDNHDKNRVN